jgi:hypothetical protein
LLYTLERVMYIHAERHRKPSKQAKIGRNTQWKRTHALKQ